MASNRQPKVALKPGQARRVFAATAWYEAHGRNAGLPGADTGGGYEDWWIELTAATVGRGSGGLGYWYSWKKKRRVANAAGDHSFAWVDDPAGFVSTDGTSGTRDTRAINTEEIYTSASTPLAAGTIVRAIAGLGADGVMTLTFQGGGSSAAAAGCVEVLVKKDGGADGNDAAIASWTYAIYALSDTGLATPLATGLTLQDGAPSCRFIAGEVVPALDGSKGIVQNNGGTWTLLFVPETKVLDVCEPLDTGAIALMGG